MSQRLVRRRFSGPSAAAAAGAVLALVWAIAVSGQSGGPGESGPYPRLPGAVSRPPEWLGSDAHAPFDLTRYFAVPPRASNAAPLYLDALFEFSAEMGSCFPDGPERDRRRLAAADRSKRYLRVADAFYKDAKSVPGPAIDEVIKLYDTGFRKLAEAQRRERCVFETGIGTAAQLPHSSVAARQVARVASMRIQRALERRNFDGALRDVETVLRLTRDLQPRGAMMSQLVVSAMTQLVCTDIIDRILPAPGLRAEHCDRLLTILAGHDAKVTDGYAEGLRFEYLSSRGLLLDLVHHQPEFARQFNMKPGTLVNTILASAPGPRAAAGSTRSVPDDADARVARADSNDLARVVREFDTYYRMLLGLDGISHAARITKIQAVKLSAADDLLSQVGIQIEVQPAILVSHVSQLARGPAILRGTECLVALRRWQITHRGWPRDLATAVKGTALKTVPTDPYDGKPMRMALLNNQPVVYCVGKDGRDDGGQKDSDRDIKPLGDWLFRLPTSQGRR